MRDLLTSGRCVVGLLVGTVLGGCGDASRTAPDGADAVDRADAVAVDSDVASDGASDGAADSASDDSAPRDADAAAPDSSGPEVTPFGHGSPRPACPYELPADRVPWVLPTVLDPAWDAPVKLGAPIATACPEDAIEITPDGAMLYFLWTPEVNPPPAEMLRGSAGTYFARRLGDDPGTFGEPRFFELRTGAVDGAYDGELSFTPAGDKVYFHSTRRENMGWQADPPIADPMDIYVADMVGGVPGSGRNLGSPVNSVDRDGEHCLDPAGTTLYLTSTRPGGLGGADLWQSTWDATDARWSEPQNLGAPINGPGAELQPAFAANEPDTLYFTSDRSGANAIWVSRRDGVGWSEPTLVVTGYVGEASLVADGSLLYFVHVLIDERGPFGADIWYSRRHR